MFRRITESVVARDRFGSGNVEGFCLARWVHRYGCRAVLVALILLAASAASGQSNTCEVPFRLERGHMILVKGRIGGLKNQAIMIDTGAYFTVLSHQIRARLQLFHQGSITIVGPANAAFRETVTVDKLQLGQAEFRSITAIDVDLSQFSRSVGTEVDAVVGLDLLGRGTVTIDFGHSTLRLSGNQVVCRPGDNK